MNRYMELWGWVCEVFGEQALTIDQFRAEFPSPDPAKVVHDLARLKLIARLETGVYKPAPPIELPRRMVEESMSKEKLLDSAPYPFAYSHDDAVRIWTDGYYWTGFTAGYKPVHIHVNKTELEQWRGFFQRNQADSAAEEDRKTLFGLVFILHPVPRVQSNTVNGVPVIPLSDTLDYCRERIHTYAPALEYLRRKFHLKPGQVQPLAPTHA